MDVETTADEPLLPRADATLQIAEVFLQERFVLAPLYIQFGTYT
jgi:hypothetical protein